MNINNKRPLIVFMTGPWEWGLEKMRLKRPCRSFLEGVTLLDLDGKEVGSCSGPSDSLCVFFKIWLLSARQPASPTTGLWRPRVRVDGNVSPHGEDLISRQTLLPYSSGLLPALPVTCIGAHAQSLGRPGSDCRIQTSFPGVPRVGAGWYGCCSPTASLVQLHRQAGCRRCGCHRYAPWTTSFWGRRVWWPRILATHSDGATASSTTSSTTKPTTLSASVLVSLWPGEGGREAPVGRGCPLAWRVGPLDF